MGKDKVVNNPSTELVLDSSALSISELNIVHEYFNNGQNGTRAYMKYHPGSASDSAKVAASNLLNRTHVKDYIQQYKDSLISKVVLNKESLIGYTVFGLEEAKANKDIGVLFKGVEVGAKLTGAYENDVDDLTKYTGLLTKIKANNVQININNNVVGDKNE